MTNKTLILLACIAIVGAAGTAQPADDNAVLLDGSEEQPKHLWGWGFNENGQVGDGTTIDRPTAVEVVGPSGEGLLDGVIQFSAGEAHTLAVTDDGTVWAWGANWAGQLGDGTIQDRYSATQVVGADGTGALGDVVQVSGGTWHSLALKSDGTVWAWGNNYQGALGDGTTTNRDTPVQVVGPDGSGWLGDVQQVAAGFSYSLALKTDGTVWAWGDNWGGQLGDGTDIPRTTPVQTVIGDENGLLGDITQVAAQRFHGLAVREDGTVHAWGQNWDGQLGDGTTTERFVPVQVVDADNEGPLSDVLRVSAGDSHSIAVKTDGTAWAWGRNNHGQLGDGTTTNRHTPVQVLGPDGEGHLEGLVFATTGDSTNLALTSDGTAWGWGYNGHGNIGDGTSTDQHTPVNPVGFQNVEQVSIGWLHTLALAAPTPPAAPQELDARPGSAIGAVDLSWEPPLYTSGELTHHQIYRSTSQDAGYQLLATVPGDATWYLDDDTTPLTTYHYRITAVNAVGESDATGTACSKPFPWVQLEDDDLCWVPSPPL